MTSSARKMMPIQTTSAFFTVPSTWHRQQRQRYKTVISNHSFKNGSQCALEQVRQRPMPPQLNAAIPSERCTLTCKKSCMLWKVLRLLDSLRSTKSTKNLQQLQNMPKNTPSYLDFHSRLKFLHPATIGSNAGQVPNSWPKWSGLSH